MPLPIAAGIFTILIIFSGIVLYRLEKRTKAMKRLEKLLADSSRELASLETLKSHFLIRIGDVLSTPLRTIEASSTKLTKVDADIPEDVRNDIQILSDEVRSLIRILGVFEDISAAEMDPDTKTGGGADRPGEEKTMNGVEIVQMDDLVSEAAMDISEDAADKMVSLSVAICDEAEVLGKRSQLFETVLAILRESLKRADPSTVMTVDLKIENNIELEICWDSSRQQVLEEQDLLGAGFIRLVASSHGGWLNTDMEHGSISLILPFAGED
ncbi:MAG: hypothetical protein KAH54_03005 [Candidatus Sabulitectum sp.]|nr:hypothetical protein [Candidatus Sabulitectum sp.]